MNVIKQKDGLEVKLSDEEAKTLLIGEEMILIYSDNKLDDNGKPTILFEWHTIPESLRLITKVNDWGESCR